MNSSISVSGFSKLQILFSILTTVVIFTLLFNLTFLRPEMPLPVLHLSRSGSALKVVEELEEFVDARSSKKLQRPEFGVKATTNLSVNNLVSLENVSMESSKAQPKDKSLQLSAGLPISSGIHTLESFDADADDPPLPEDSSYTALEDAKLHGDPPSRSERNLPKVALPENGNYTKRRKHKKPNAIAKDSLLWEDDERELQAISQMLRTRYSSKGFYLGRLLWNH
eukprot:TRINITY_DN4839_c0_g1_i2.p1 TRINITY_DN4839_c0_g1~~TRINITY_DN4839_c0_g1_i2.p1  ORF type:complete len:225 (+),score=26.28 TRINITY_DN4839_c0_g1_i2:56-730(+)